MRETNIHTFFTESKYKLIEHNLLWYRSTDENTVILFFEIAFHLIGIQSYYQQNWL